MTSLRDRAGREAVVRLGHRLRGGTVVLSDAGAQTVLGDGEPRVHVTVHDPRAYGALLRSSVGLAESYMQGWWDCDDLTALVRVLLRNTTGPRRVLDRAATLAGPVLDPVALLRRRDTAADRSHVRAHYDLGNDFFALMLDETMTYSCALFERSGTPLAEAQAAKLDRICRRLRLAPDDHVVEIGTGWGSFALHAAVRYGCRITTTTISAAQHQLASKRVAEAGLADRVTVLHDHYRDLTGAYDKLVSIEMIEAVDWRDHRSFFGACADRLRPGGLAAMQAIVIGDEAFDRAKHHDDFIRRYIFPGGCLPSVSRISSVASAAGLQLAELEDIGRHYPRTLRSWRANLAGRDEEVAALGLDAGFRRMWDLYLTYCEAAFLERHVSDVQVLFARPR